MSKKGCGRPAKQELEAREQVDRPRQERRADRRKKSWAAEDASVAAVPALSRAPGWPTRFEDGAEFVFEDAVAPNEPVPSASTIMASLPIGPAGHAAGDVTALGAAWSSFTPSISDLLTDRTRIGGPSLGSQATRQDAQQAFPPRFFLLPPHLARQKAGVAEALGSHSEKRADTQPKTTLQPSKTDGSSKTKPAGAKLQGTSQQTRGLQRERKQPRPRNTVAPDTAIANKSRTRRP